MDKAQKEYHKKCLIKDKIKVIVGFLISVLALANIFLVFELSRTYETIETLQDENSKKDDVEDVIDFQECTLTVTDLNDIHPIEGCAESRLTIDALNLREKEVTVTAIFSVINEDDFYSLDLVIDNQEVESDFFSGIDNDNDMPSYIWTDNAINFFTISENGVPTLLGINSLVAGQCNDEFLQVINSEGEIELEVAGINVEGFERDSNNIENTFKIRKSFFCSPSPCDADLDPDTVIDETKIYELNNGELELIKEETFTYSECPK
jgi:hypothetical protein